MLTTTIIIERNLAHGWNVQNAHPTAIASAAEKRKRSPINSLVKLLNNLLRLSIVSWNRSDALGTNNSVKPIMVQRNPINRWKMAKIVTEDVKKMKRMGKYEEANKIISGSLQAMYDILEVINDVFPSLSCFVPTVREKDPVAAASEMDV